MQLLQLLLLSCSCCNQIVSAALQLGLALPVAPVSGPRSQSLSLQPASSPTLPLCSSAAFPARPRGAPLHWCCLGRAHTHTLTQHRANWGCCACMLASLCTWLCSPLHSAARINLARRSISTHDKLAPELSPPMIRRPVCSQSHSLTLAHPRPFRRARRQQPFAPRRHRRLAAVRIAQLLTAGPRAAVPPDAPAGPLFGPPLMGGPP